MLSGRRWPLLLLLVSLFCCKQKKKAAEDPDPVTVSDFLALFPVRSLPLLYGDSIFTRPRHDSAIRAGVVEHFVPDSVYTKYFGKSVHPRWWAAGRVPVKKAETYLLLRGTTPTKKALYLLCFDKDEHFTTAMPLMFHDDSPDVTYESGMDAKYAISVTRRRRTSDGRSPFKRMVYVYNDIGVFTLIMTEGNDDKPRVLAVINPIDTLPHKHKFTGDYVTDKRNFVSVRDGRNASVVRFFVHFEKDGGACNGELKGEAKFVSPTVARYSGTGDPCTLDLTFTPTTVTMKELEGCGNHRDIKCYFDGTFKKQAKKEKPAPKKGGGAKKA